MEKLFIPLVLGTTRGGRESEKVARYIFAKLEARPEVETRFIDPREFDFALNDDGRRDFPAWQAIVEKSDGFLICSPEYNHGYPASLKFLLDQVRPVVYMHRAVGVASAGGPLGGARMIENLMPVLRELGLVSIRVDLRAPEVKNWEPTPEYDERITKFIDELVWMSRALKNARV